ncbi:4a-hydroxytetrahydrobiopterin dehydratase [Flavobacterium sp. XGLA_31]|uniref:4a-hydroxytetrahydrobiopterin dehydratase n=1 Tax=Flavobacterium sp. XGLA_31 TaxID=3447666 RepID=UPI003F37C407
MTLLTNEILTEALAHVPGWVYEDNAIRKEFVFKSFPDAISTVNKIAVVAEEMNHHPEWTNVYNKLIIRLYTHDSLGVTTKDIRLAHAIEVILKENG